MKKNIAITIIVAGTLFAGGAFAQGNPVTSYLNDTADGALRVQFELPPELIPPQKGFFATMRSLLGIRQPNERIKPEIGTKLVVQASAYASSPYQTDSTPCITAAGTRVREGVVATNFLPLGAILEINGDKFIVEDRMNSRYAGYYMDIWFPSTSSALEFGRKKLDITIVGYGEPGDEVRPTPEPVVPENQTQEAENTSVWQRFTNQIASITSYLSTRKAEDVNKYDVDCISEPSQE